MQQHDGADKEKRQNQDRFRVEFYASSVVRHHAKTGDTLGPPVPGGSGSSALLLSLLFGLPLVLPVAVRRARVRTAGIAGKGARLSGGKRLTHPRAMVVGRVSSDVCGAFFFADFLKKSERGVLRRVLGLQWGV